MRAVFVLLAFHVSGCIAQYIAITKCSSNDATQQWTLKQGVPTSVTATDTGACLAVNTTTPVPGTDVAMVPCDGSALQSWSYDPSSGWLTTSL